MLSRMAAEPRRALRGTTTGLAVVAALIGLLGAVGNLVFRESIAISAEAPSSMTVSLYLGTECKSYRRPNDDAMYRFRIAAHEAVSANL